MNSEQIVNRPSANSADGAEYSINVCVAAGCLSSGSDKVKESLEREVHEHGLDHKCKVKGVGCLGLCSQGTLVAVEKQNVIYNQVTQTDAKEIVESLDKKPIERLKCDTSSPFFKGQTKIVLENSGIIDPEKIEDYLAADGYSGLTKALTEMSPNDIVDHISKSGLRGRGGAGYPTGLKWSTVAKAKPHSDGRKFVICNADEGDPGAFMDRSVLESDPFRVLEGMAIAAYATGASQGYIYVRAEYPLAVKRLRTAIRQAEKNGYLGSNILETTFSFRIDIRLGAGAFVCGEETALIASIEGKRGAPRPRPPYPAASGLWNAPTLINNVETYANVPSIVRHGSDWFAGIGTEKSKGTKVFALAGRVKNTGLIEVPIGISLREVIYDIAGGIPDNKKFKAVQTGGPSGGCIPAELLDMKVDYETLAQAGSIMGSGGMIVADETSCMVDVAKFFMEFCMTESCGKCIPCRVGTSQMYDLLYKITSGEATMQDLDHLKELCEMVQSTSLCGLGQSAPNPVLSTLRYFPKEYEEHILHKKCPAGVCKMTAASGTKEVSK